MLIDDIIAEAEGRAPRLLFFHPDQQKGEDLMNGFLSAIKVAQAFDFNDVETAYESHVQAKEFIFARDVFCALPPYPITWCECSLGGHKIGGLAGVIPSKGVFRLPRPTMITDRERAGNKLPDRGHVTFKREDYIEVQDTSSVIISPVFTLEDKICIVPSAVEAIIGKDGAPISFPVLRPELENFAEESVSNMVRVMAQRCSLFWFGFSLLACKNITTELKEVDAKLQRARQRRGKQPLKNFYVLNVQTGQKVTKSSGARGGEPSHVKRLHMVRGHLADYTEGPGLFGKYKGRFWIPAHARGNADAGQIKKTYAVKPPVEC